MPGQRNRIDVRVFPSNDDTELTFKDVNFISFVVFNTYGIPAVIADAKVKEEGLPVKVLYINPSNIAAVEAVRHQ